jgi:hypothetical protein
VRVVSTANVLKARMEFLRNTTPRSEWWDAQNLVVAELMYKAQFVVCLELVTWFRSYIDDR